MKNNKTLSMVCLQDFEDYAAQTLPRNALDYYRTGADQQVTLADNIRAFQKWKIRPRCLRDVSNVSTQTSMLGHQIDSPICVAPTAIQRMAHPEGELASSYGSYLAKVPFSLSTQSTTSIEDVASNVAQHLLFFQLFIYKDRHVALNLVRRAEASGYKALLLTVDTPVSGKRIADNRNRLTLPPHLRLANFDHLDESITKRAGRSEKSSGMNEFAKIFYDSSVTWKDVKWLKSVTKMPIIIKGILTGEDAELAVECGVDGILVSNHGARQLDTVPATLDVLPEIVVAVKQRCEVYVDGGVRTGTDVFKALALGAKAVFVGRPIIYALAYNGADGVKEALEILKEEFRTAMALAGCSKIEDISSKFVVHESYYSKAQL